MRGGEPTPSLEWIRKGVKIEPGDKHRVSECDVMRDGEPTPSLEWIRKGVKIEPGDKHRVSV